jgi:hypothetical protein
VTEQHDGVRFEKADVEPRAIARFGIILLVVISVVAALLVPLLRHFAALEGRSDPPPAPLARHPGRLPPEPRLQTQPFADIEKMRAEEEPILTGYGWVDEKAGVVRIPVEEAMRVLAARGLPARGEAPPAAPCAGGGKKK